MQTDQPISALMNTDVFTARADDTVESVNDLMRSQGVSSIPVVEVDDVVVGIITAADLLQFKASRRDPALVRAWEICTYQPERVAPQTSVAEVARLMTERGIHHVIVAENEVIKGIVSSLDFVRQFVPPA